ncbi:MAG: DUF2726 domain-containing protein [Lachnospiraceae bacterium]|nr:DUF2726 domain-containing protein [Lachnospiraceae bacterium]
MNAVCRDIFRAIHEGKWLSIEYRNKKEQITKYWIGIRGLNPARRSLAVEGLHLGQYSLEQYDWIYIDSILSSQVLDGTYCPVNQLLVKDIAENPHRYQALFAHTANLKILNYLEDCNRMDATPYRKNFALVKALDRESFTEGMLYLSEEQYRMVIREFQSRAEREREEAAGGRRLTLQKLAMNVLSIHTAIGLYVLAYRKLALDVKERRLKAEEDVTICTEFTVDGVKQSARRFLDAEDYELLQDFAANEDRIKDAVMKSVRGQEAVDDMPYLIGLGMETALDLHKEYNAILEMYQKGQVSVPIRAFFGELLERGRRRRTEPITLLNRKVNLDQLLAIHNAISYPVAYIQGPPGTGKTSTIINTIITAFFNEKTVLFVSHNNHPIDGVTEKLSSLSYGGKQIPFPIIRLGNQEKVREALRRMRRLYDETKALTIFETTLERNRDSRTAKTRELSGLLKKYEAGLELKEREETLERMLDYQRRLGTSMQMLPFEADLGGRQMERVKKGLDRLGKITDRDALALLEDEEEELQKYLYYVSAKYVKRMDLEENRGLKEILMMEDEEKRLEAFQGYLKETANLKRFQRIFPIIATTCYSSYRLGAPRPQFDMTIMDEASQCNTAVSLVPILRGERLMLVGDPQQLNPVILLDEAANRRLRKKYMVPEEYDYRRNSVYKVYLACDAVSDEVLLRHHYRCNQKIIDFNNRKYYNSRLLVCSGSREEEPLEYVDVSDGRTEEKNTAPAEVEEIVRYAKENKDKSIGIITPFVNQRNLIEKRLAEEQIGNASCGTVHAFQGDEKQVVLFSTALTDETHKGTYDWLKNNQELINVATSRAVDRLVVLSSRKNLERLHGEGGEDDLYELIRYVQTNGSSKVASRQTKSRALGIKPFTNDVEEAFLTALNHALDNLWLTQNRFSVEKEVVTSRVLGPKDAGHALFPSGCFDFVVYEESGEKKEPVLVIELDGKEHAADGTMRMREQKKQEVCRAHGVELIHVENSYARRYQHVKGILQAYFAKVH